MINHVNTALYNILRESMGPDLNITFGSPAEDDASGDNAPRLYVFLYNIVEDPFSKNKPDEYRGGNTLLSSRPPLAVNLYYMLTPFSLPRSRTTAEPPDPVQAHTIIAQAMRGFYDNGVVDRRYFPGNTTQGESQVRISCVQMNLEEITKIWSSFNRPYRLSICYEVSIVLIQSEERPKEIHLVEKAGARSESEFGVIPAIGKRNLSKLKNSGWKLIALRSDLTGEDITDVRPVAVLPGMAIAIYGRGFNSKKKMVVKIGGRVIEEGSVRTINENLIKIKVPPDEEPGPKKLSLNSDNEDPTNEIVTTFEVLSTAPLPITISEIRPDKGMSGDLITIYGINFAEDARVSIANVEATTSTFVDKTQINIMIPVGISTGTTLLTVKTDQGTATKPFRVL